VVWPDGSIHWLAANGLMFFDDRDRPFRMVGFTADVTRRKQVEEELRRTAAFSRKRNTSAQPAVSGGTPPRQTRLPGQTRMHRGKMMAKMKVHSVADLVKVAMRLGLTPAKNPWHVTSESV
jgi:PAS domain-containing protein